MKKIDEYLTIKKAAEYIGVTPNTLRNWEKENKITCYRNPINKYRLYKTEDLKKIINNIERIS